MNCKFCNRDVLETTEHHLIPKVLHKKMKKKKRYNKAQLHETIESCMDCHNHIHRMFTNKELEVNYNTFELLFNTIEMQKFIKFVRKKT